MKLAIARAFLDSTGPSREAQLVNAMQSLTLLLYDCLVVYYDLQRARDGQRQRVYVRMFAVLAMDAIDRFSNPLGTSGLEFRDITLSASLEKPLLDSKRKLIAIRRNHAAFLEDVRNKLIAHRPIDAQDEIRILGYLDVGRAMRAFKDVLVWLTSLQFDLTTLLFASAKLPVTRPFKD